MLKWNWFHLAKVICVIDLPSASWRLLESGSTVLQVSLVLPFTEVEGLTKLCHHMLVDLGLLETTTQHVVDMNANHANDAVSAKASAGVCRLDVREVRLLDQKSTGIQKMWS